ncbi:pupal cuticle protein C1B-like [Zeugodacus cucurbitae]|uniref:pupal cuticle protein C1B-like n=1 Tax=Zeugodacus cucurbitae TaxID=28588 RepID=UPI0005967B08|nr:pupal cuticle protein C1B-like [Zeugodacus cucurbitae]
MKFLICLALLFAVAQANPGIVAPLTYSAVPRVATYAVSPYTAYPAYAAPAVRVYSAPVARVAAVAPAVRVAYSAPVVSTLLK